MKDNDCAICHKAQYRLIRCERCNEYVCAEHLEQMETGAGDYDWCSDCMQEYCTRPDPTAQTLNQLAQEMEHGH